MSEFLTEMAAASYRRVNVLEREEPQLIQRVAAARPPIPLRLAPSGFDVIAEVKLASPAAGMLTRGGVERVTALAVSYVEAGAAAVSVLTEETRFCGSIRHLGAVATTVGAPVMRKDFLVAPIQVLEARVRGASGVLLIARMLPGAVLVEMTDLALELGMFVVVEVFDRSDLETAAHVFDRDVMVGVNSRDLVDLEVDRNRFRDLAPHLPDHLPAVAESGLSSADDVAAVARLGYRLALIGSSLITSEDPGRLVTSMIETGRAALAGAGR